MVLEGGHRHAGTVAGVVILGFLVVTSVLSISRAACSQESDLGSSDSHVHTHSNWLLAIGSVGVVASDELRDGGHGPTSEGGLAIALTSKLSPHTGLSLGIQSSFNRGRLGPLISFSLGPRFWVPKPDQLDQLYFGLSGMLMSARTEDGYWQWSVGPQFSLGMDYRLSGTKCFIVDAAAGIGFPINGEPRPWYAPVPALKSNTVVYGTTAFMARASLAVGLQFSL